MGIIDFFKKKKIKDTELNNEKLNVEVEKQAMENEKFIPDISLYDFENTDWLEFGRLLKQNKLLPNSYNKKPSEVVVKLSKAGQPMVLLTFKSETSNSVRKFMLLQNQAFQYVNDAIGDGKNQELNNIWNNFKDDIRLTREIITKRTIFKNIQEAESMIESAKKKMQYRNIDKKEQAFLKEYRYAEFDDFCNMPINGNIIDTIPSFVPLGSSEHKEVNRLKPAVPFSPKTLEFCILHMTNGEKTEHGEYVEEFEQMCRELQEYSCYESENWDQVIEIGKKLVAEQYKKSCHKSDFVK